MNNKMHIQTAITIRINSHNSVTQIHICDNRNLERIKFYETSLRATRD